MNFFYNCLKIILLTFVLTSCSNNGEKKDTSELYEKSQSRQAILERSGTLMSGGSTKAERDMALDDAQNRLRTGGGLFGKKGGIDLLKSNKGNSTATLGMPINPYLWKASLETINFMPLSSADPFAGIIITDWYSKSDSSERCKLNIFIKGVELKTSNLKVNSFCETLTSTNNWVGSESDASSNIKIENAILNKAKKIKLSLN